MYVCPYDFLYVCVCVSAYRYVWLYICPPSLYVYGSSDHRIVVSLYVLCVLYILFVLYVMYVLYGLYVLYVFSALYALYVMHVLRALFV